MAATVGELVVNLTARTGAFDKGLRASSRHVSSFGKNAAIAGAALMRFLAPLVGVVGVMKGIHSLKGAIDDLDRLAKVSKKLGLVATELSALRFEGQKAGIAVNTIDMALQRMTRRAAEAAVGTGEAKAAIAELGLDPGKMLARGPFDAMLQIADAFEKIESPAQRVRLAFKLFDSEGVDMVNMLSEGSEQLENARRKMEQLGLATTGGTAAIERMKNQWAEVGLEITAVIRKSAQGWAFIQAFATGGVGGLAAVKQGEIDALFKKARAEIAALEMQKALQVEKASQSGQGLIDKMGQSFVLRGMDQGQKRIALWLKEARSVGMAREELREYAITMAKLYQQQKTYDMGIEVAGLKKRAQQARSTAIQSLIAQQLGDRGGGALQLPGAYGAGSAQAYSATVRAGMQQTGKKTDQEILDATLKLLKEEEDTKRVIEGIAEKIDDLEVGVTNLR